MITQKKDTKETEKDTFSWIDSILQKRLNIFFVSSFIVTIVFTILLFDPNVSAFGDDSAYIQKSFFFIKKFHFPTFQGPLYPIILSPFILIFGVKTVPLKILSLFFILGHLYFFHKTFKNRVPAFVHASVLLMLSLSSSYLYYAYQTYAEAFFLFIQSIALWYFVKNFTDSELNTFSLKKDYRKYLLLGLIILLMGLTRSVGYCLLVVVILYFIFYKKWYAILPTVFSFSSFYIVYSLLKKVIWGISGSDFKGQLSQLLYKNHYHTTEGKEEIAGFIQRFVDNSHLYISKHLYVFMGLRELIADMPIKEWLTVLTYLIFIVVLIFLFKKNKYAFFSAIYVGVFFFITFIIIQNYWDQDRLIIPFFPLILISLISGIYYLLKTGALRKIQFILPVILIIALSLSAKYTIKAVKVNSKLEGPWHGLTPDMINYVKASRWANQYLPKNAVIACRKPAISFIYTNGRAFAGIYNLQFLNISEVFKQLNDTSYVLIPYNAIFNKNVPSNVQSFYQFNLDYILTNDPNGTCFINANSKFKQQMLKQLNDHKIPYYTSLSEFLKYLKGDINKGQLASPDSLLNVFKKNHIDFVLDGSLRYTPAANTGDILNTIQAYRSIIGYKYPGIFEKVVQIGENNAEPAMIYQIRYDKYGIQK